MRCEVCGEQEERYKYLLNDGSEIGVCKDCGISIYENTSIKMSRLEEIIQLIEFVKFEEEMMLSGRGRQKNKEMK